MDRTHYLDWCRLMLGAQLGVAANQIVRQQNNVQHGFARDGIALVRAPADGVGIGIVANVQPCEVRAHLFTYDADRSAAWHAAGTSWAVPYALPLEYRRGDKGDAAYLEFAAFVAAPDDFGRWCAPVFGYVALLVAMRNAGLVA